MRKITLMKPPPLTELPKRQVAGYARVSKETVRTENSLAAQVSYYSQYIQSSPNWEYAGVYIDRFIPGTQTKDREEFKRMLADCEAGKIDIILVKSVSRFARNTLDLLTTTRRLKELGVEVIFEEENISTVSSDGEFFLTVIASLAEEEMRNMSDNIKWTFRTRFEQGIPHHHFKILGYDWVGDNLVINTEEAEVVKRIFNDYLSGSSVKEIERALENRYSYNMIRSVLSNETYTGALIMQRYYSENPLTKKCKTNHGELSMYKAVENHDAIIDYDTFERVQNEIRRRAELGAISNKFINTTSMTGKIKCGYCGNNYIRTTNKRNGKPHGTWTCRAKLHGTAASCSGRIVPEKTIKSKFTEVCGQEFTYELFEELISEVIVLGTDTLQFHFKDGRVADAKWELTGNKDHWTAEERAKRSEFAKAHPFSSGTITCFTGKLQCGSCGNNFRRNHIKSSGRYSWGCRTGKQKCGIRWIREDEVKRVAAKALGLDEFDEKMFTELVDHITMLSNDELTIHYKDGREQTVNWNSKRTIRRSK